MSATERDVVALCAELEDERSRHARTQAHLESFMGALSDQSIRTLTAEAALEAVRRVCFGSEPPDLRAVARVMVRPGPKPEPWVVRVEGQGGEDRRVVLAVGAQSFEFCRMSADEVREEPGRCDYLRRMLVLALGRAGFGSEDAAARLDAARLAWLAVDPETRLADARGRVQNEPEDLRQAIDALRGMP